MSLEDMSSRWYQGASDIDPDTSIRWIEINHCILAEYDTLSARYVVLFAPSKGAAFIARKQIWRKAKINPEIVGIDKADKCIKRNSTRPVFGDTTPAAG